MGSVVIVVKLASWSRSCNSRAKGINFARIKKDETINLVDIDIGRYQMPGAKLQSNLRLDQHLLFAKVELPETPKQSVHHINLGQRTHKNQFLNKVLRKPRTE